MRGLEALWPMNTFVRRATAPRRPGELLHLVRLAVGKTRMLKIQKDLSRSFFAILSLPATAMGFALSVQISALSWILATKYGLEIHDIGLVWAAGPIAGIFGQVIIGGKSTNSP